MGNFLFCPPDANKSILFLAYEIGGPPDPFFVCPRPKKKKFLAHERTVWESPFVYLVKKLIFISCIHKMCFRPSLFVVHTKKVFNPVSLYAVRKWVWNPVFVCFMQKKKFISCIQKKEKEKLSSQPLSFTSCKKGFPFFRPDIFKKNCQPVPQWKRYLKLHWGYFWK